MIYKKKYMKLRMKHAGFEPEATILLFWLVV